MALDTRLPLAIRGADLPGALLAAEQLKGAKNQNQLFQVAQQERAANQPLVNATRANELDMERIKANVLAAEQLRRFVEAGDLPGAAQYLQARKSELQTAGRDTAGLDATMAALQAAAQKGDASELLAGLENDRAIGVRLGILKDPSLTSQAKPSAILQAYLQYQEQGGKLPFVDPTNSGKDFVTQFSRSQVGAQYGAPTDQPGIGIVQPSRVNPDENRVLAPETDVQTANAQRAAAEARAKEIAQFQAQAEIDLPSVVSKSSQALKDIRALRSHPGLPYIVGWYSKAPIIPGSQQAAAEALANQVQGRTFMEAYQGLKGGGQITEIEGTKAEAAIARLYRAQKLEDYQAALDDLADVIEAGLTRARRNTKVGTPEAATTPEPVQAPANVGRFQIEVVQ